ncbi:cytochrome P450 6a2-like [Sitophilus oryzae]|uniref:Cytochrome P450 6a2-like n=1 Tax=Sitophilus oryzae TaxID=7048 RepID=A0A6J2YC12_SITOR|nr:cytochrome P450 6a2-like [Sitophilus oryzae]
MILVYLFFIVLLFIIYVKRKHTYWKRRGLFQLEPEFFFGNSRREVTGKLSFAEGFLAKYKQFKALGLKHGGTYTFIEPVYIPIDPVIIKNILVRDFWSFTGHGLYHHPSEPLSMHLFNLEGELWKQLRSKLTPTFTSGKIKMMFETLLEKVKDLEKVMDNCAENQEVINIKELGARFTTDVIASCAFGLECNSLENPESEFRVFAKKVFAPQILRIFCIFLFPDWFLGLIRFKSIPKDVTEFFSKTVLDTIRFREESKFYRKDFMQLLLELKNSNKEIGIQSISNDEIIAQCYLFFLAGFETSSTTITFAFLELAQNQDVQDKLRSEILKVLERYNGEFSHEALMEMTYLDMIVNETLRLYPPLAFLPRICNKTYKVPDTEVVIENGTRVNIPIWGLHKDPEYYPDPEKFNPENFSEENKAARPDFTYMPFGEGPRMCIGLRFGLLQTKLGIASLVRKYKFTLNERTKVPISMESTNFLLSVDGDVCLNINKI